jgi:hypothetical protein
MSLEGISATHFLSSTRIIQQAVNREDKLYEDMSYLHKVFANSAQETVHLNRLTLDDIGLSTDLLERVRNLRKQSISVIHGDEYHRRLAAHIAVTVG